MQYKWKYDPHLSSDDFKLFYTAAGDNPHAFHPIAISNLDGLRYRFICNSLQPAGNATKLAIVELYKPRAGNPYITRIFELNTTMPS